MDPDPPTQEDTIFTVGVWDLLHPGHVDVLTRMRQMCGELIVGVVSDDDIAKYKRKPIMTLDERVAMVAALKCVDRVVVGAPLPEETTIEQLDSMNAHYIAKAFSKEERVRGIREHAHFIAVRRFLEVPRSTELSTTEIIDRIIKSSTPSPIESAMD